MGIASNILYFTSIWLSFEVIKMSYNNTTTHHVLILKYLKSNHKYTTSVNISLYILVIKHTNWLICIYGWRFTKLSQVAKVHFERMPQLCLWDYLENDLWWNTNIWGYLPQKELNLMFYLSQFNTYNCMCRIMDGKLFHYKNGKAVI